MQNYYTQLRLYLIVIIVAICSNLYAQYEVVGTPFYYKNSGASAFEDHFQSYNLYKIDLTTFRGNSKTQDDPVISLRLGKSLNADIVLFKNDLFASGHSVITDGGRSLDIDHNNLVDHYEGYILDDLHSEIRISIGTDYIYGYIQQGTVRKFIEPATNFNKALSSDVYVIYDESEVKSSEGNICAAAHVETYITKNDIDTKSAAACGILDIAVAMDNSYVQAYGSNAGAINQATAILNMVEPNYANNNFNTNFEFSIVQHFIPTGAEPWTSSQDAVVLLNSFTSWGGGGFTATHDIGQFWTNRDMYFVDPDTGVNNYSVAGLAWVNTICGSARYHILEDFTSSAWQLRVLTAHEMGHNFGSNHDNGSGNIMSSSVSLNTNTWSAQSKTAINNSIAGFNCFTACQQGSCSQITDASVSNCAAGIPSTYTLTLQILHGGGAAGSAGFNVLVDGGTYFQPWQASPQTVIIDGLSADGTANQTVTLQSDNNSDAGCAGSITFDEPKADCSLDITENFNNCQKPTGWTTTTTQGTTVNGGDPLVQYEWKFLGTNRTFGNYASYDNGATSKTIDGSCMAIMDDDIFNPTWYSGTVRMLTAVYDVSDYDDLILSFDYLFHPFEDGGKGANNSYFRVEVWDGSSYVTLINDENSTCGWTNVWQAGCMDSPSIDITAYRNAELQIRFTFSDGGTGAWAGMAAVDNFRLTGSNSTPIGLDGGDDCDTTTTVSGTDIEGEYRATEMVRTEGVTSVSGQATFSASSIELLPGFKVGSSMEFTADNDGCITN